MRAQQGELKDQARDRGLETRADLGDDLLQASRLDLEPGDKVRQQLDERLCIAVESAPGHDKRLQVVVVCGE